MSTPRYFALPYTLIRVSGEDATRFLQGQCSCDVEALGEHEVKYGTCNTAKGRMVALFRIQRDGSDYLLRLHQSLVDKLLPHLSKYKVFFKCELSLEKNLQCIGILPSDALAPELPGDHWQAIEGGRYERLPGQEGLLTALLELAPQPIEDSPAEWLHQAALAGLPELFEETSEQFILQHLNLQELDGVSFSKGCYTGQEIIARMKYLGKLKKRMFVLTGSFDLEKGHLPTAGNAIYDATGNKAGELVQIQGSNELGWAVQAVCDLSLADQQKTLFLDKNGTKGLALLR